MSLRAEQHRRVEALVHEALRLEPDQRPEFLRGVRDDDEHVYRELKSLLAHSGAARGFLEPGGTPLLGTMPRVGDPLIGTAIGAYRVIRRIGAGGMGAVYLAERGDGQFEKRVAVKVVHAGLATGEILERFSIERHALAGLEHPNIARLLDGGATENGLPYLIMEYVDGRPLDEHCDERRLSIRDRLMLFRTVCDAVQHAHQNLVVHRDLKPGNILVSAEGRVKLLDFGVARILADGEGAPDLTLTAPNRRYLTPRYASPEQLRGQRVSTATDVYSLGVILFELLTGRMPYRDTDAGTHAALVAEPTRPSSLFARNGDPAIAAICATRGLDPRRLRRALAGDLDTIILTALRKEPQRRYASVEQLSEDIAKHLDGRPVTARPDTFTYRAAKLIRRNMAATLSAVAVLLALIVGLAAASSAWRSESRQRVIAEQRAAEAQLTVSFFQDMLASVSPDNAKGRDVAVLREVLDEAAGRVATEFASLPAVAGTLHLTIGRTYEALGVYDRADEHLARALALRQEVHGRESLEAAEALVAQSGLMISTSRYEEAERLAREALRLRRAALPDDDPLVCSTRQRLAEALRKRGDYDGAEEQCRRAVAGFRAHRPGSDASLGNALGQLGKLLVDRERTAEAAPLIDEALDIHRRLHGETHPVVSRLFAARGWLAQRDGRLEDAEADYRRALEIDRRTLDPDHRQTAATLNGLASVLEAQQRYADAEPLYREALAMQRRRLGERHSAIGTALNDLAGLYRRMGRYDEAQPLFLESIDIYRASLGPDHIWTSFPLANLALLYEICGDHASALARVDEAIRIRARALPPGHHLTAAAESIRGGCLAARGDLQQAEVVLLECYERLLAQRGAGDANTILTVKRLGDLYERWEQPAESAMWRARLPQER